MALSATFTANFSSFYDAVDKAEIKLKEFGAGADNAGKRLSAMGNQFSGVKIIQDATLMVKAIEEIGGTTKLTEKELAKLGSTANEAVAKMKALGMDVPKNLQKIADETKGANKATTDWMGSLTKIAGAVGIAFSVDAVVGFVGGLFEAASAIKDMSAQWGVSTKAVQQWTAAAKGSGVEAKTLGNTLQHMTAQMAEGSDLYRASLDNIGLSYEKLRKLPMEEQYKQVIAAIQGVQDETLQLDIAIGILGPNAKQMIGAIRDGFIDAADAQNFMADTTIKRLTDAQAKWKELADNVTIYSADMLAAVMGTTERMTKSWGNFFTFARLAIAVQTRLTGQVEDAVAALTEAEIAYQRSLKPVPKDIALVTNEEAARGKELKTNAQLLEEQRQKEERRKKGLAAATKAIEDAKRAEEAYTRELKKHDDALDALVNRFGGSGGSGAIGKANDYIAALRQAIPIEQMTAKQKANINAVMDEAIGTYQALGQMAPKVMYDIWLATRKADEGVVQFSSKWKNFSDLVNKNPIDLGAGVTMSLPPALTLLEKYGTSIRNVTTAFAALGRQTGGGFGDILSSVGGVAAGLDAGAVAAKAFGAAMKEFKPGGDVALGMANTAAAAAATAVTFLQLTEHAGVLDSTMTGAAMGLALAPKSLAAFGLAAGAVAGYVRGLHNVAADSRAFFKMRGDFLMLASGAAVPGEALDMLAEKIKAATGSYALMTQLMSATSQYELQKAATAIGEAFEYQSQALGHVTEAAARYGITLEELGPAMQRQQLDEQAAQLYKDWQVLNQAGLDTIVITDKMGEAVSAYVNQATAMGREVPIAMKPMLEAMIQAGTLTDENGLAFEDLEASGISFAMTMSEGFKGMIDEVKKLTDAISRSLGLAITNIPQPKITGQVTWNVAPVPEAQTHGGGAPEYARGTDGFVNFGKGTPVILHGWEAVVPRDAANATVTGGGGGAALGGGMMTVIVEADGRQLSRIVAPFLPGEVRRLGLARG